MPQLPFQDIADEARDYQLALRGNQVAASTLARPIFVMATSSLSNPSSGLRVDCLANIASIAWRASDLYVAHRPLSHSNLRL